MSHSSSSPGILHQFSSDPELTAFEHTTPSTSTTACHVVLLIPGLNGSYPCVPYASYLANAISRERPSWSLVQLGGLSSAGPGWGSSNVRQDAIEIAQCLRYLRQECNKDKVILMGHSTGQFAQEHWLDDRRVVKLLLIS